MYPNGIPLSENICFPHSLLLEVVEDEPLYKILDIFRTGRVAPWIIEEWGREDSP